MGPKEGPWRSPWRGPKGGTQGEAAGRGPSAAQCEVLAGQCCILGCIYMSVVTSDCSVCWPVEGQRESKTGFFFIEAHVSKVSLAAEGLHLLWSSFATAN